MLRIHHAVHAALIAANAAGNFSVLYEDNDGTAHRASYILSEGRIVNASWLRQVSNRCGQCAGTGQFITGTVNGKPVGPGGICFRCAGKGYQSDQDVKRNDNYDRYGRRVYL